MKSSASAPGKIILLGEHFVIYGARAILCAIDRRVSISAETIPQRTITIESEIGKLSIKHDIEPTELDSPLRPLYHLAREITKKYNHKGGIAIKVKSDIPAGVGLGSSSACCVAGAAAISALFEEPDRQSILRLAVEAEKTIHQNTSGADCAVCTHGGVIEFKSDKFTKMDIVPDFKIAIVNSEIEHSTGDIVSHVKQFKKNNKRQFSEMLNKEDKLVNDALLLIKKNDLAGLGRIMTENQLLLDMLGISNQTLKMIIRIANEISFGAKITGAGGGGCIIALNNHTKIGKIIDHFHKEGIECFSTEIDFRGVNTF